MSSSRHSDAPHFLLSVVFWSLSLSVQPIFSAPFSIHPQGRMWHRDTAEAMARKES